MKTAGKWLVRILIVIVLLIVLGIVVFLIAGNQLIKFEVQKGASSALKVPVTLGSVNLSVLAGKVELQNLVVGNPPGYEIPNLMKLGDGRVAVSLGSLMSDTVDIGYIVLDNVDLSIEQKGFSTNLNDIIKSLPKSPEEAQAQQAKPGKKLRIKTLEINNVNVTVKLLPIPGKTSEVTLKLAPIKMTDLGSDNKLDVATLSSKILAAIAEGVAQQGAGILPNDITGPLKSELGQAGHLLQGVETEAGGLGKGIIEQGQKASKGIFGIFKKDANSK
jgi:uncharacterized protein involved in outer membrane biogenesis